MYIIYNLPCKTGAIFYKVPDIDALILTTTGKHGPRPAIDEDAKARECRQQDSGLGNSIDNCP